MPTNKGPFHQFEKNSSKRVYKVWVRGYNYRSKKKIPKEVEEDDDVFSECRWHENFIFEYPAFDQIGMDCLSIYVTLHIHAAGRMTPCGFFVPKNKPAARDASSCGLFVPFLSATRICFAYIGNCAEEVCAKIE